MKVFDDFKKDVKKSHAETIRFLRKMEDFAKKIGNKSLLNLLIKEKERIQEVNAALQKKSKQFKLVFESELKKRNLRLETKVASLSKTTETLTSNNYLLEYKKKDLLLLANKLEEAYEEISLKNNELLDQQNKISEQTEILNTIHQEILEKNRELESQKESLLDQSDYLHEANETITFMHKKVELQNNEILEKNEELLSLNNEKNNLISIVAHDLKSPLSQIRGLLSIMKTSSSLEETNSYITMIEGSASRLSDMIAKILDVEAIESQSLNLKLESINVSELLVSISERYKIAATQKKIMLQNNIQQNLFACVDRNYVDQVFENLISNAIKFSPSDKNIFINLQHSNGTVVGEIKDEGPGLDEDDKKKLFGKYQKLSAKPTGNETSTGLGLSIVKKFVTAMDGEIWCESDSGKGASFLVSFKSVKN